MNALLEIVANGNIPPIQKGARTAIAHASRNLLGDPDVVPAM